jgi:iron complex outermembrane recepter protein
VLCAYPAKKKDNAIVNRITTITIRGPTMTIKGRAVARTPRPAISLERRKLASAIAAVLAIPAMGLQGARAQDAPAQQQQPEEVLVTGSRIVRRDFEANSPIQTVDESAFESQNSIALETALNDLPQFVPAAQGLSQLQDQSQFTDNFSTLTAGASTISLRGLGSNRNLVLLDGYRAVPVNAKMSVDLNSIPAAAIERVEVITGGASSVYGADAVAGVVNFILKKNFEGIAFDVQTGAMQNGEGAETRASALFGVNSADERGNIMVGVELAKRESIHADDVDFYHDALRDGTVEGTQFLYAGPYYGINNANPPSRAAVDGIFTQVPGVVARLGNATTGSFYWNEDGTVYTGAENFNGTAPAGLGAAAGAYRYNGPRFTSRTNAHLPGDYPYRQIGAEGEIIQHLLPYEANIPLDRTSVFGRAEYELTDTVSSYVQLISVQSDTRRLFNASPAVAGWGMVAPYGSEIYAPSLTTGGTTDPAYLPGGRFGLNCLADGVAGCTESEAWPVSPELRTLLDSRANPNEDWSFNYSLDFSDWGVPGAEPRSVFSQTRTNQLSFGLRGDIEGIDGGWDVLVSNGSAKLDLVFAGNASLERVRTLFTRAPNWGTGFFAQGNSGTPGGGFSGGVATCTSGMPVFRDHSQVSQDCLKAIFVALNHQSEMTQKFVEANVQGHLVDMPAGEARFSVGLHSRENSYFYNFDPLQNQESFNDNPMGFPSNNVKGETAVDELYGELLVPLLKDKPGAEHLNLELGYRYSDYELQGGIDTFKALLDWGITPTLRFRGGRQLATRAPNIAELFQAEEQSWSVSIGGDPCAVNNIGRAYGANAALNPNGYQQARALCSARMGPVAAQAFYAPGALQPNAVVWLPFVNATGNPTVKPEEAKTWTAGFVWRPSTGRERLDGLSLSIDWYNITITDMIAVESAEVVYAACLSVASNPTGDPLHPSCLQINRNPANGFASPSRVKYVNAAFARVAGVDLTTDWRTDLAGGTFGVNFMISSLLEEKTQDSVSSPVIEWKGSLGPTPGTSLNNGAYDYRTFTTVNYGRGDWNLALRWRHLPTAIDATEAVANAVRSPVASTQRGAEQSYDVFDLSGGFTLTDRMDLRFGIDNLFDEQPVITGRRVIGDDHPSTGAGTTEAGFYDILGRSVYVGLKMEF